MGLPGAGDVLVGGTTGGDQPIAGTIFGVDANNGKLLWTFKTTKDDPKSWPGGKWEREVTVRGDVKY